MTWRHRAGERVGPWTLEAPLGQGGFSEVWRGRRGPDGPAFAVKLLTHPEHASQLRAEADALARVRGPSIVALHEVDLRHDPPYLVMDLVPGGNLRQLEARQRPDVVRALETIEQVLGTLARVHREGVVHGDLKPENILVDARERLLLADFGLSRRIAQRTATLSVSLSQEDARLAGTLDYMAPEQRAGQKPTARSDVYACGVLLYELLVGARPQGVFQLPGALDRSIPPAVDRLIACALAQDPRHRFATAGAMLAFLRAHPREEWRVLARAHEEVSGLLAPTGGLVQVAEPGVFGLCTLIVGVAVGIVVWCSRVGLDPGQALGAGLGLLIGLVVTVCLYAALLPALTRSRLALDDLKARLEEQIQTGRRWSGATTAPPLRGASPRLSIEVRPRPRSP